MGVENVGIGGEEGDGEDKPEKRNNANMLANNTINNKLKIYKYSPLSYIDNLRLNERLWYKFAKENIHA